MTEQEWKIIEMWEYIFFEQQRAENDFLQYKDYFKTINLSILDFKYHHKINTYEIKDNYKSIHTGF